MASYFLSTGPYCTTPTDVLRVYIRYIHITHIIHTPYTLCTHGAILQIDDNEILKIKKAEHPNHSTTTAHI